MKKVRKKSLQHELAFGKKDTKHLIISIGVFVILLTLSYFLNLISTDMEKYYIPQLRTVLNLYLLPLIWLVFGWLIMHALRMLDVVKPGKSKFSKPIHVASLTIVILYAALMIPVLIESINTIIQFLHYKQNPALYPAGYQYAYNIPIILSKILTPIINVVYNQPSIFVIPGIAFSISRQIYQDRDS